MTAASGAIEKATVRQNMPARPLSTQMIQSPGRRFGAALGGGASVDMAAAPFADGGAALPHYTVSRA